jgi:hypothetical protein
MALATEKYDLDTANSIYAYGQVISATNNMLYSLNNIQSGIAVQNNKPFNKVFNITRPSDTTAYLINQLLNTSKTATVLQSIDCGISNAGKTVNITSMEWLESNGVNQFPNQIIIYDVASMSSFNCNDGSYNTVSIADHKAHFLTWIPPISASSSTQSNFYTFGLFNVNKTFLIPVSGLIYLAIYSNAVAVPVSGESFQLNVKGTFL